MGIHTEDSYSVNFEMPTIYQGPEDFNSKTKENLINTTRHFQISTFFITLSQDKLTQDCLLLLGRITSELLDEIPSPCKNEMKNVQN